MEEVKFRATKLIDFPPCSQNDSIPIAQCIISSSEDDCLYILFKNSISILNITNGNKKEMQTNNTFLPFITYDPTEENPTPYVCTSRGELLNIFEENRQDHQIIGANPFILYDNQVIVGDKKSGVISIFNLNDPNNKKLTLNKYETFSLGMFNIFRNNGIFALAANSKFVFALTNDGKVLVFDILNGQKISSTTVCGSKLESGIIKCDEENYYLGLNQIDGSKVQAVHFSIGTNQVLYEIQQPIVNFIEINEDNIVIMTNKEVTLHNKNDGKLIASFLVPVDDLDIFKSKYSKNYYDPNLKKSYNSNNYKKAKKDLTPRFAHLLNNNILLITTNSSIYRCRPILPIESYVLNLKIDSGSDKDKEMQLSTNLLYASVEFARTITRENWIEFEENVRTTSDPTLFAYKVISQYLNCDNNDFNELASHDLIKQIEETIKLLSLSRSNHNQNQDQDNNDIPLRIFYRSACSEVIFAYSFFSRCVYFLIMFLTYKNQTAAYSHYLRELSMLVHDYTQLSLLAEIGDNLPIELFDTYELRGNDQGNNSDIVFSKVVMSLISKLLDFDNTMNILMNHRMYEKVVEITSINSVPLVYHGKSLLKLNKFDEAVDFFIQNSGFLANDNELTEFVFQTLRSNNRDDLIIRIGSINSEANAAALFRAYIKEKDYDSAFNCILTTHNEPVKCNMLRVFIRVLKKNKLHQLLLSYPFVSMISMFVNELWCYSIDTLILAFCFFREIGDRLQATQALYLYARCLLRTPTKENLGKALTAMNLVFCQMSNCTVRDVGPKDQELNVDKLWRIMCRTRCCLLLDDNENDNNSISSNEFRNSNVDENERLKFSTSLRDAPKMSFSRLLEIAATRNKDIFENALTGANDKELLDIIPNLIHQKLIEPLYKLLSLKNKSKNPALVEKTLKLYIKTNQVPPTFVIDKFIAKNITRFFIVCSKLDTVFRADLLYDAICCLLRRKDKKKFFYLVDIMRELEVPEEIIQEFQIE